MIKSYDDQQESLFEEKFEKNNQKKRILEKSIVTLKTDYDEYYKSLAFVLNEKKVIAYKIKLINEKKNKIIRENNLIRYNSNLN